MRASDSTLSRGGRLYCALLFLTSVGLSGCQPSSSPPSNTVTPVASSNFRYTDIIAESGVDYEWKVQGKRPLTILQTIGNGCALFDYNNDGNLDLLLVGTPSALYAGDGKGKFRNVSSETGVGNLKGRFLGCAIGDIDNDGDDDVYLSGYRCAALLANRTVERQSGKTKPNTPLFENITAGSGLKQEPWGTSCAFFESVPGSGKLDLYVANYVVYTPQIEPQLCNEQGRMTSCGPRYYQPERGVFYRNMGNGKFADKTIEAVGANAVNGKGLGVAVADYLGKGRPGIAIANDEMPGDLLRPMTFTGEPKFKNEGEASATAYDRDGNVHGGMGVDWGDYDNDGKFDLFVATFQNEPKSLYHNDGEGAFSDRGFLTGAGVVSTPFVAFGCKFLDFDNDGWLDIVIANGHVQDNIQDIVPTISYRQTSLLLRNKGTTPIAYEDVTAQTGNDVGRGIVGRGLAVGDWDNDGKQDIVIADSEGKPLLLHNRSEKTGHWLGIKLIGKKSNRNGYGAVLTAQIGDKTLTRQCQSCGSYLSASDPRVHFGLGDATKIDKLTISWPSGQKTVLTDVEADQYLTITESATQ
jgi:enediyne biosynthesis protein E4